MDLAKREVRPMSIPQSTFRRETTMPRANTDLPGLEVNAPITRPDTSKGDALAKILGLVTDTATKISGQIQEGKDQANAAQATLDFSAGTKDDKRFAKSLAYRDAWQQEGAKKLARDISQEVTDQVQAALNNETNPPTVQEVDQLVESIFIKHTHDEHGNMLDFGTPKAKTILGNSLAEIKATIMPQVYKAIKDHTDERYLATKVDNSIYEHLRGAEVGAPVVVNPTNLMDTRAAPMDHTGAALVEPFRGFSGMKPNSVMGAPRQNGSRHNGEDFPIPTGTPLKAPMAGTVIAAFSDARGGNQVRVKMADGAIVGYAHLSRLDVKKGDPVQPGFIVGLSGHSGDATGPHVHMTVEVNGKKVSPSDYFKHAKVPDGSGPVIEYGNEPQLAQVPQAPPAAVHGPFDFEGLFKDLPPSIDRGTAKTYFMHALISEAVTKGDPSILDGLENSHRADGTPSFTPDERIKIAETRDTLREKLRVETDRATKDLQEKNSDAILQSIVDGNTPSTSWIADQARKGLISNEFAYSMVEHARAEAKSDAAQARMEARQAKAEEDNNYDVSVGAEEVERRSGILTGATADEDLKRYRAGEFGPVGDKKSIARLKRLRAASVAGEQVAEQNPEFARWSAELKVNYMPRSVKNNNLLLAPAKSAVDEPTYRTMQAFYVQEVHAGKSPASAYADTVQKFAKGHNTPGGLQAQISAINSRMAELQAKKAAAGK